MNSYQGLSINRRGNAAATAAYGKAKTIAEHYNAGHEAKAINELTGIPLSTVYYHLQRLPDAVAA